MKLRAVLERGTYSIVKADNFYLIRPFHELHEVYKINNYNIVYCDHKYDKLLSATFEYLAPNDYPLEIEAFLDQMRMMNVL